MIISRDVNVLVLNVVIALKESTTRHFKFPTL
jgi:hypothetical protein